MILLLALAAILVTVTACDSETLVGTTWKGANSTGDEITIEFLNDSECDFGAMGRATYTVEGDQVTVMASGYEYVFTRSVNEMKGAGLRIFKQP
jgi:hypothetical protein